MTEPCCPPHLCDVRPERIRFWLHEIRVAKLSNLDPVLIAREYSHPRGERHMGRGGETCGDGGVGACLVVIAILDHLPKPYTVSDVQHLGQDVEGLARKLCPFAVECAKMPHLDHHA